MADRGAQVAVRWCWWCLSPVRGVLCLATGWAALGS